MISKKLTFSAAFLFILYLGFATADDYQAEVETDDSILSSFLSHNNSFSPFFVPTASKGEHKTLNVFFDCESRELEHNLYCRLSCRSLRSHQRDQSKRWDSDWIWSSRLNCHLWNWSPGLSPDRISLEEENSAGGLGDSRSSPGSLADIQRPISHQGCQGWSWKSGQSWSSGSHWSQLQPCVGARE